VNYLCLPFEIDVQASKIVMKDEFQLLQTQSFDEQRSQRLRQAFLMSVIVHLLTGVFILIGPTVFPQTELSESTDHVPAKDLGFLALPKDYQKVERKTLTPKLFDKNRIIQNKISEIAPKTFQGPHSKGNSKRPDKLGRRNQSAQPIRRIPTTVPQPPSLPPPPSKTLGVPTVNKLALKDPTGNLGKGSVPKQKKETLRSSLQDLYAGLRLPGSFIPESLERAKRFGSLKEGITDEGDSQLNFDNPPPKFSVNRPRILSDTEGVNFSPWLTAVYFRVRDNWYSVIPQVYRSGLQGVVVIVFDVYSNGRISGLRVVRSSGRSPYDRAAISSLKLSEPFPEFPTAFSQDQLTLQLTYLYNIGV